ncbi:5-formyltetrahydrofolate cyclo-ligase isoform X2 [Cylas formicarius]|uniref:5-formyltetrahydrofolate cyclo-ligase isoform X2 n=1 Tax=Cylas formicarius TaxID=197179 RepID=UPI0029587BE4|nr:5-formyltetrahydrofolate cyclo-ligase isoform X2 [Cylas formicarius]
MDSIMASIQAAKAALRQDIQNKVSTLSTEEKQRQSKIVLRKLLALPVFQTSQRVSVFLSTEDEINTEPVVRKIFEDGKTCFVPRYSKAGMQMVRLYSMDDWENLPLTKWNIKQPALKEQREDALETGGLDLIIIPGVAFTKEGFRMGHGGGYYDAFLTKCKTIQQNPPSTVAVTFKEQVLPDIPKTEKDVKIDIVLYAE